VYTNIRYNHDKQLKHCPTIQTQMPK